MRPIFASTRRLYSPTITTNALRLLWVLLILWGELGIYFWSISPCRWPTSGEASHALLISDAQINVPSLQPTSSFPYLRDFIFERFLRKSWHVTNRLKPHVVFFLGDMLGSGKSVRNEAQYAELVRKFKSTFPLEASIPRYHLPGNNDVGMGLLASPTIRTYYQKHFGPLNDMVILKNHTFLALDAPGLVDEDYQRNARGVSFDHWEPIPGGAVEAVRRAATILERYRPLVLLSHIPLYRPDAASCGPLREKGTIHRGVGHGYQNTIGKQTTAFLMKALDPSIIFSGDDRDYCEYTHEGTSFGVAGSIPEITVKSYSPAPQIRRPGFQLVSIIDPMNSASQPSLLHRSCLLPNQSSIFTAYIWWSVLTLCILLILNVQRVRYFRLTKPIGLSLTPSPSTNNHTSPLLHQDTGALSPVWSPHTPFIPPTSPRPQIPSSFRTPMAPGTPTFRATSGPAISQGFGSPMLSPQLLSPMHDDEDSMFPDRYTTQREVRSHPNDEEWTPIGRDDYFDSSSQVGHGIDEPQPFSPPSQFISAPGNGLTHHRRQSSVSLGWSWTFVLKGRRRRITLRVPRLSTCWSGCKDVVEVLRDADRRTLLRRRRGIFASTLIESISVFWPAGVVWLVINCCVF
ncbi:hypothetical protein P691DRAFT_661989 [Macrolepiota fuliginosa MF-IS2]|uniref:Calcineurin-like phosphoesterase domain-containing protein n=1 Tax=Macrolepiota fuliginosa MF-IS2 TaxID=1400762 RepID=A0A9P6C528_9AGAR|nr:hypothetical protein P691DRAFT_661989 [Macrolepiota fuliginosa MF-IS2]